MPEAHVHNIPPPTGWNWKTSVVDGSKILYRKKAGERAFTGAQHAEMLWALVQWLRRHNLNLDLKKSRLVWVLTTANDGALREFLSFSTFHVVPADTPGIAPAFSNAASKVSIAESIRRRAGCNHCGLVGGFAVYGDYGYCSRCVHLCTSCNRYTNAVLLVHGQDTPLCTYCIEARYPHGYSRCYDCSVVCGDAEAVTAHGHGYCPICATQYHCPKCNNHTRVPGERVCSVCKVADRAKNYTKYEDEYKKLMPDNVLLVEDTQYRKVRPMSIETEVNSRSSKEMASILHTCGAIHEGKVQGYGFNPDVSRYAFPAYLKHDGSVTGGELVLPLFNPSDPRDAARLGEVFQVMNTMEQDRLISTPANCGGHMHIDAHRFGMHDVWRLMLAFGRFENVIYRFAGAGCPYGHRSSVAGHSVANGNLGYANKVAKGPFGNDEYLRTSVYAMERMSGLNMTLYTAGQRRCRCAAYMQHMDTKTCTCDLGKMTIEWRVFNSSTNPRILHAWMAFMQSMHSWAERPKDQRVTRAFEADFPAWEYTKKALTTADHPKVIDAWKWFFTNLWFSAAERESIIYTIKQVTDFESIEYNWDDLKDIKFEGKAATRNATQTNMARKLRRAHITETRKVTEAMA